jgi:hypothetical protein
MRRVLISVFFLFFGLAMALAQKPYVTIDYPNAVGTQLTAVSPSGDIVGRYSTVDPNNPYLSIQHGFLYSRGKFTSIDYPGALQTDADYINARGEVVGYFQDPNTMRNRGYTWSKGKFKAFDYPGAADTLGWGISSSGVIAGTYNANPSGWEPHGYILANGQFTQVADFPGATETYVVVTEANTLIGAVWDLNGDQTQHGFMVKNGVTSLVDYPGSTWVFISGLNPVGEIVGGHGDANYVEHGFLYTHGRYIAVDFPEWTSSYANGIDPQGDIVGRYTDAQGVYHGYFLPQSYRPKK